MALLRRGLTLALMAGAFASPDSRRPVTLAPRGGAGGSSPQAIYLPQTREYYLTADQFDFARPGYHIKLNNVTIGADRKPVVDVTLTDDLGAPLDRNGVQTPGICTTTYVLAWYNPANRNYTTYATRTQKSPITNVTAIQPTSDSGGTYKDIAVGHFTYTFGTVLPAGFDMTKTQPIAAYRRRAMPAAL